MGPGIQVEQRYYPQGQARENPREMMEASMQEVKNWSKLMRPMKMNMKAMSHLPLEQKGLEEQVGQAHSPTRVQTTCVCSQSS